MGAVASISVRLRQEDLHLKKGIKELQAFQKQDNIYYRRSESEIAKMLLEHALGIERNRILPSNSLDEENTAADDA